MVGRGLFFFNPPPFLGPLTLEAATICLIHSVHKDSGAGGFSFPIGCGDGWVWGAFGWGAERERERAQLRSFKRVMKQKDPGFLWDSQPWPPHASQLQSYASLKAPASTKSPKQHQGCHCEMLKRKQTPSASLRCLGKRGRDRCSIFPIKSSVFLRAEGKEAATPLSLFLRTGKHSGLLQSFTLEL